jgi:hypothetical protein
MTKFWPPPRETEAVSELRSQGYYWPDELLIEQELRERYAPLFHHVSITAKNRAKRNGFVVRLWFPYISSPVKLHLFSRKKKSVLKSLDSQISRFCHYHETPTPEPRQP